MLQSQVRVVLLSHHFPPHLHLLYLSTDSYSPRLPFPLCDICRIPSCGGELSKSTLVGLCPSIRTKIEILCYILRITVEYRVQFLSLKFDSSSCQITFHPTSTQIFPCSHEAIFGPCHEHIAYHFWASTDMLNHYTIPTRCIVPPFGRYVTSFRISAFVARFNSKAKENHIVEAVLFVTLLLHPKSNVAPSKQCYLNTLGLHYYLGMKILLLIWSDNLRFEPYTPNPITQHQLQNVKIIFRERWRNMVWFIPHLVLHCSCI